MTKYAVGVSLKLQGLTILNNSLVDIGDLLYSTAGGPVPTNTNGLHDKTLVCVTDLEDCCELPRRVRGHWYYPDGSVVMYNIGYWEKTFRSNRGPNQILEGRHFNGSVRLWYKYSNPPGRSRFHCELPSAADPNVNLVLYANIGETNLYAYHTRLYFIIL